MRIEQPPFRFGASRSRAGYVDAAPTREAIEAVKESSHEFGIMYAPIARRSVMACFMGARIQDIVGRALLPFVSCAEARL